MSWKRYWMSGQTLTQLILRAKLPFTCLVRRFVLLRIDFMNSQSKFRSLPTLPTQTDLGRERWRLHRINWAADKVWSERSDQRRGRANAFTLSRQIFGVSFFSRSRLLAASNGRAPHVKLLLDAGSEVNCKTKKGASPLGLCTFNDSLRLNLNAKHFTTNYF